MRIIIVVVLIVLAIMVLIGGLKNKRRISGLALILLIVPAGALSYFEYEYQETQKGISEAMVEMSENKNAELDCQRITMAFFDVWASERTVAVEEGEEPSAVVKIKYNDCDRVMKWYNSEDKDAVDEDTIASLHLLSSETMRITNTNLNEDQQRCLGLKNLPALTQFMGGTEAQGTYMYRYFKQEMMGKEYALKKMNC